jgi:putative hemolysin
MSIALIVLGIIICLYFSNFFSSSEMAYSSCNIVRLENIVEDKEKGWKKAQTAIKITEKFDQALSAILIGNNLANIASSSLSSVLVILIAGSEDYAWLSTVIMTVLVIIFGETMPKIMSKRNATSTAMKNASFVHFLMIAFKPLIWLVVKLIAILTKPLKGEEDASQEESVEELQSIIETAEDEGIIDEDDSNLMQAAIDFADISAMEVMTARVDVVALDIEDSWPEMKKIIDESSYSRLPVYEGTIDNVIGILHLNRLFKALATIEENGIPIDGDEPPFDIRTLLMSPCYVYKTMKLPKVLNQFKTAKQHLAIVTDEYSGTLGVISMEDVLEQIVGEIYDETDIVDPEIVKHNDTEFEIDGGMPVTDLLELASIKEDDFEADSATVGGWTVESIGSFPNEGDSFTYKNMKVTVLKMDGRRVEKVLVKLDAPQEK